MKHDREEKTFFCASCGLSFTSSVFENRSKPIFEFARDQNELWVLALIFFQNLLWVTSWCDFFWNGRHFLELFSHQISLSG